MEQKHTRNWLEKTVLILGILLVLTTLGVLGYDALTKESTPPDIVLTYDTIDRRQEYYAVHVVAKNNGGETAQDVLVEVSMGQGPTMETARLQFPYLPGKSTLKGWAIFSSDPSNEELTLKILGFSEP